MSKANSWDQGEKNGAPFVTTADAWQQDAQTSQERGMPDLGNSASAKSAILIGCLLVLLGLLLAQPVAHKPTYAVGNGQTLYFYEDTSGRMSLAEFLALPSHQLSTSDGPLARGYSRSTFWLRFDVPRSLFADGDLWLEMRPVYLDHVTVHWRPSGIDATWQTGYSGDRDSALDRRTGLAYRKPVFPLASPGAGADGYEVVLQVRSTSTMVVEPALWQPAAFLDYAARDTSFWSFHFGVGALSSVIALLLAMGLKSRLLWSVLPFSTTYLLVAGIQGFLGWGDIQWRVTLQHYLTGVLTLLGYPALLWMCTEALDLRQYFPRLYKAMLMGISIGLILPLSIPLDLYGNAVQALTMFASLTAPTLLVCAVILWWREDLSYLNLAFGIVPMFYVFTSLLAVLTTTATIPYDSVIYNLWQYSVMIIMMVTMLLVMTMGIYRISRERQISQERAQLARELRVEREASFNQRQFMGMISHEFRTPLAVISAAIENLRENDGDDVPTLQRYDKIERATVRLVQLTDNCLADARLSAGTLYLDVQPIDLLEQIHYAAALVELSAHHRLGMTLNGCSLTGDMPSCVPLVADSALLGIALSNVLDNAMKYSEPGSQIRLDIQQTPDHRVVIGIEDEGRGIPEAQAAQVFERYRQGGGAGGKGRDGWGLGLYVARQIALAHGGDLVLAANTPAGCRFELTLPRTPTVAPTA